MSDERKPLLAALAEIGTAFERYKIVASTVRDMGDDPNEEGLAAIAEAFRLKHRIEELVADLPRLQRDHVEDPSLLTPEEERIFAARFASFASLIGLVKEGKLAPGEGIQRWTKEALDELDAIVRRGEKRVTKPAGSA